MSARLVTTLLGISLLAAGCTTSQPSAFIPPPIPPHPKMARSLTPAPAAERTILQPAVPLIEPRFSTDLAVHTRREWAERPLIKSRLEPMGRPMFITVHHEGPSENLQRPPSVQLAGIEEVHEKPRSEGGMGAGCIGYHYLIDSRGEVWEGRPMAYQGAHAGNNDANRANIGVCLLGNFEETRPTPAQKLALRRLLASLMAQYSIPATRVCTHREVKERFGLGATDCPGRNLQPYVEELRREFRIARR